MKLEFSGSPVIHATRDYVWSRLTDPDFVAASAPGVETVEALDPTHFKVVSGLGVGAVKVRFNLEIELFDMVEGRSLKMRSRGNGSGLDGGCGLLTPHRRRCTRNRAPRLVRNERSERGGGQRRRPISRRHRAQADARLLD